MTNENAMRQLDAAIDRDPRKHPLGVFGSDDGPPAYGGGVGGFLWFDNDRDAARALLDADFIRPRRMDIAASDVVAGYEEAKRILESVAEGRATMSASLPRLNENLKGVMIFSWSGDFSELTTGDSAFIRKVRSRFRGDYSSAATRRRAADNGAPHPSGTDGNESVRPVGADELDAFVRFLGSYGL